MMRINKWVLESCVLVATQVGCGDTTIAPAPAGGTGGTRAGDSGSGGMGATGGTGASGGTAGTGSTGSQGGTGGTAGAAGTGATGGAAGVGATGGSGGCAGSLSECNGTCVDLMSDPNNCGSCGTACGTDQACDANHCYDACGNGRLLVLDPPSGCATRDGSGLFKDTSTELVWTAKDYLKPGGSEGLSWQAANDYCAQQQMVLPTRAQVLAVAAIPDKECATPCDWTTWTTTAGTVGHFSASKDGSSSELSDDSLNSVICVYEP